jgi:hypothetical protein
MSNLIDNIIKVIDGAPAKFNGKLPAIERRMLDEMISLVKDLQIKNGRIVSNMANLKLVNGVKKNLEKLVVSKQYLKDLTDFVKTYDTISTLSNDYFKSVSDKFKPSAYYKEVKNSAVNSAIDALTKGIHAGVISPLRDVLLTAVTSGQIYADLTPTLKDRITGTPEADGSLTRYARTHTVTAISQFNGQYIAAINNEMGFKWYRYRGSNLATTREFCEHMVKKDYIHESEFTTVLSGNIDGHKCSIYGKTGLPYGLMEGTNADNFVANKGGWNCGHSLYPVPDYMVPKEIREKIEAAKPIEAVQETLRNNIDLSDKTEYEKVANYTRLLRKIP